MRIFLYFFVTSICIAHFSCRDNFKKLPEPKAILKESLNEKDSTLLTETFEPETIDSDSDLTAVKENFNRINTNKNWDSIIQKNLWISTEGGYVKFYYANALLQKATVREYGETYQRLSEYYFTGKEVSFIYEKDYRYKNSPFLDSFVNEAEHKVEHFNLDSSRIEEKRHYVRREKIIKTICKLNGRLSSCEPDIPGEQKRLAEDIAKVLRWAKSKEIEINK